MESIGDHIRADGPSAPLKIHSDTPDSSGREDIIILPKTTADVE
jgi:hypothetical protein